MRKKIMMSEIIVHLSIGKSDGGGGGGGNSHKEQTTHMEQTTYTRSPIHNTEYL